jgi:hypothetical protein
MRRRFCGNPSFDQMPSAKIHELVKHLSRKWNKCGAGLIDYRFIARPEWVETQKLARFAGLPLASREVGLDY